MITTDLFETQQQCPECGGPAFSDLILAEKKDACYNKVRSRYKVWPSAYASGALVQCRKKGAANWGNKSESVAEGSDMCHVCGQTPCNCTYITENHDNGEYSDEAGMAHGNLITIAKAARGLLDTIDQHEDLPEWVQEKIAKVEGMLVSAWNYLQSQEAQGIDPRITEVYGTLAEAWSHVRHRMELTEEFDIIQRVVENLAVHNGVDHEVIWEDLESLTDDELYVFAVTTPIMEDWQKANKRDKTDGMSRKAVKAYRREHPGSKLQTAVTTKPSKLKKGSKASKRRKSYCSRSRGQMKMHHISCAKTPDKAICKARRRWNCESMEHSGTMVAEAGSPAQQAAIAIAMKKAHKKPRAEGVAEAKMSPQQQHDFDRMRAGAMSRKEYDAKWKKPRKSDDEVIYGKRKSVAEMDKSQPSHGRDGRISHSTYGSRDKGGSQGMDRTARMTTADRMMRDAEKKFLKHMSNAEKVDKGYRNPNIDEGLEAQVYKVVALDKGNALKKPTKLNVKASSIEDVFSRLAANDWYALSINGVEVVGGKRLKQGVAEVSDATLTSYLSKVHADSQKHDRDPSKRSAAKRNKSVQGFARAFNKLDARKEKVDEISKDKLAGYLQAAHRDVVDRASSASFQSGQAGDRYNRADVSGKEQQREKGMARAVSRLTKENSMADELAAMAMRRNPNALVRVDGKTLQSPPPGPKPAGTTTPRPAPAFDPEAEYSDDYSVWQRRTQGIKEGTSIAEAWARRYPNINADIAECKSSGDGERLKRLMSIKNIIDSDLREQSGLGFGQ